MRALIIPEIVDNTCIFIQKIRSSLAENSFPCFLFRKICRSFECHSRSPWNSDFENFLTSNMLKNHVCNPHDAHTSSLLLNCIPFYFAVGHTVLTMRSLSLGLTILVSLDGVAPPGAIDACAFLCAKLPGKSCPDGVMPRCQGDFCTNVYVRDRKYHFLPNGEEAVIPDGGGPVTCQDAITMTTLFREWDPAYHPRAKGFHNFRHSCYINAFLQVLLHTRGFAMYIAEMQAWLDAVNANVVLQEQIDANVSAKQDFDMYTDIVELYHEMHDPTPFTDPTTGNPVYRILRPENLIYNSWGWYALSGQVQEDSAQAFNMFLDSLKGRSRLFTIASRHGVPRPTTHSIKNLFSIRYAEDSRCEECGHIYSEPSHQFVYSLNFPEEIIDVYKAGYVRSLKVNSVRDVSIVDLFGQSFENNARSTGAVDCANHPRSASGAYQKFHRYRTTYLTNLSPPILVLALQRTVFINPVEIDRVRTLHFADGTFGAPLRPVTENQTLVRAKVNFPEELDLATIPRSQASGVYRLRGIGIHSGNESSGHYVAAFFDDESETWLLANDHSVVPTSLDAIRSNPVYTISYLVYEKISRDQDDAASSASTSSSDAPSEAAEDEDEPLLSTDFPDDPITVDCRKTCEDYIAQSKMCQDWPDCCETVHCDGTRCVNLYRDESSTIFFGEPDPDSDKHPLMCESSSHKLSNDGSIVCNLDGCFRKVVDNTNRLIRWVRGGGR